MKISAPLMNNFKSAFAGRLKLKLFKLISGSNDEIPLKKDMTAYVEKAASHFYPAAELFQFILTNGDHAVVDFNTIEKEVNVGLLFAELNSNPLNDMFFYEIRNFIEEKIIGGWISCNLLKDKSGYFYTVILMDEERFPDSFLYYIEIRVSHENPEPAFTFFDADGQQRSAKKNDREILKDEWILLCLQLLNYLAENYKDTFVPVHKVIDKNWKSELRFKDTAEDPLYSNIIQRLELGKTSAFIAAVDINMIRPFSYRECYEIPLFEIEQAIKLTEKLNYHGLPVYFKDEFFVVSDDYVHYIALRIAGFSKVNVVIMGDEIPENVVAVKKGGSELIPPLLLTRPPAHEQIDPIINESLLGRYIEKLRLLGSAKSFAFIRCVVLTEDKETGMLENLLISNGFEIDEVQIMSYSNCTNIAAVPIITDTLKQIKDSLKFVVHRDRDYLTDSEIDMLKKNWLNPRLNLLLLPERISNLTILMQRIFMKFTRNYL